MIPLGTRLRSGDLVIVSKLVRSNFSSNYEYEEYSRYVGCTLKVIKTPRATVERKLNCRTDSMIEAKASDGRVLHFYIDELILNTSWWDIWTREE